MSDPRRAARTWSRWDEIPAVCLDLTNLGKSLGATVVVGTILFFINQSDVVLGGRATSATWTRIGLSYLVPFLVSNYGIVVASRRSGTR